MSLYPHAQRSERQFSSKIGCVFFLIRGDGFPLAENLGKSRIWFLNSLWWEAGSENRKEPRVANSHWLDNQMVPATKAQRRDMESRFEGRWASVADECPYDAHLMSL